MLVLQVYCCILLSLTFSAAQVYYGNEQSYGPPVNRVSNQDHHYNPYSYPFTPKSSHKVSPQSECETTSGIKGICRTASGCEIDGGIPDGSCALDVRAVCCVKPPKCDGNAESGNTFITNPGYPKTWSGSHSCTLYVKLLAKTAMVKLVLHKFELEPPNTRTGKCDSDTFKISGPILKTMFEAICGENNKQHIWVPVNPEIGGDITLVIHTSNSSFNRIWMITVFQFPSDDLSLPPPICMQYFDGLNGSVSSFNSDASTRIGKGNIDGLNYAICFQKEENYCSIDIKFVFLEMSGDDFTRQRRQQPEPSKQVDISKELLDKLMKKAEFMNQMKSSTDQPSTVITTPAAITSPLTSTIPAIPTIPNFKDLFTTPTLPTLKPIPSPTPSGSCEAKDTIATSSTSAKIGPICSDQKILSVVLSEFPFQLIVNNRGERHGRGFSLDYVYNRC